MRARRWLSGVFVLGLSTSACGHIPGYYPEGQGEPEQVATTPKAPPAPPPRAVRRAADEDERHSPGDEAPSGDDEGYTDYGDGDDELAGDDGSPAPAAPAPRPPRYTPPQTWEPPTPQQPTPPTRPTTAPPARPPAPVAPAAAPQPQPADGVKVIRLDADTYYLVDAARNLCFLRHKESMTAVDCARIATETPPAPATPVAPARPEPAPAKAPPAAPSRGPASPTPDETVRFEAAFTDIFCDRKGRDDTPPETRIQARGLSVERYEAIEAWWASDENAWFTLTQRAARGCRR